MVSFIWFFVVPVAAVCLLLRWVHSLPLAKHLKETNDVVGFYFTIIGAIYAVVLAFMLVAVWERFEDAGKVAAQEANLIQDVYRLAEGLPPDERQEVRVEARRYVESVIHDEWPAMSLQAGAAPDNEHIDRLWSFLVHLKADAAHDTNLVYHLQSRYIDMNEQRRLRWVRTDSSLPPLLWRMLLFGGVLTVGFCMLFGMEKLKFHAFKTVLLTLLVFSMLYSVWELDLPYQREVLVTPVAFQQAIQRFDHLERITQ